MKQLHLEIIFQGEQCPQCFYMREAVEAIIPQYGDRVRYTLVEYQKSKAHARRFFELSISLYGEEEVRKKLRCAPIPSLFFDGKLMFDVIPRLDELAEAIERHLGLPQNGCG